MKIGIGWIIAAVLVLLPAAAQANEAYNVRDRLDKMKQELNLTPEQTTEVRTILEDYKTQLNELERDKKNQLDEVLDNDQMNRLEEMEQGWVEKFQEGIKSKFGGREKETQQKTY